MGISGTGGAAFARAVKAVFREVECGCRWGGAFRKRKTYFFPCGMAYDWLFGSFKADAAGAAGGDGAFFRGADSEKIQYSIGIFALSG